MQRILSKEDLSVMLLQEHSVLYFYVDWSAYATEGLHILEEVESILSQNRNNSAPSFWLADVSDVTAPAAFIGEWLKTKEREDLNLYNAVGVGNGSLAWLKSGEIVDFVPSITLHDASMISERIKNVFGKGAT